MKETGILFTPENHRLILSGAKTETRRVFRTPSWSHEDYSPELFPNLSGYHMVQENMGVLRNVKCLYGNIGDRLYIKEGIITHVSIPQLIGYYMDGCRVTEHWEKRLTAMFMPKWAARTWLEITDVRIERLQDISEKDAIAEGIIEENVIVGANCNGGRHQEETAIRYFCEGGDDEGYGSAVDAYHHLWDQINGKKHPWSQNCWVWVLSFRRVQS